MTVVVIIRTGLLDAVTGFILRSKSDWSSLVYDVHDMAIAYELMIKLPFQTYTHIIVTTDSKIGLIDTPFIINN